MPSVTSLPRNTTRRHEGVCECVYLYLYVSVCVWSHLFVVDCKMQKRFSGLASARPSNGDCSTRGRLQLHLYVACCMLPFAHLPICSFARALSYKYGHIYAIASANILRFNEYAYFAVTSEIDFTFLLNPKRTSCVKSGKYYRNYIFGSKRFFLLSK